jgi:UPF0755 protein
LFIAPFPVYFLSAVDAAGRPVEVDIEKGLGIKQISEQLYDAGLIKSSAAFILYSALTGSAHQLKPGHYVFTPAMNLLKINAALVRGPQEDAVITVTEGETMADIERSLVEAGVLKPGQLTRRRGKSLEGFFFPDTYRFFINSQPEDVIGRFVNNFYRKAMPILANGKWEVGSWKSPACMKC